MPKVEASLNDLKSLIGKDVSVEEIEDLLMLGKTELDEINGDEIKLDFKDTNRPDLWSVEGVARQIRYWLGDEVELPEVKDSGYKVIVSPEMKDHRPYTASFVAKGIKWTEASLSSFIQLQEKLSGSFGLNRREVAIGAYPLDRIAWPIHFKMGKIPFKPLGFDEEMEPEEILKKHPKGREFGHLLSGFSKYPMFVDSDGKVLSMPPITNSEDTGKVEMATGDVFVEASGFNLDKIMLAVQIMAAALHERGAEIYRVETIYPQFSVSSPEFGFREIEVALSKVVGFSGLDITEEEAADYLRRYGYLISGNTLRYPSWRRDIMHWRDVAEDLLISYGYNNINPEAPDIYTIGRNSESTDRENKYREAMVGLGFQEVMTFVLSNPEKEISKTGIDGRAVEIANPMSSLYSCMRMNLFPSLLEFESKNQRREYPHHVFESGDVVVPDEAQETSTRTEKRLCAVISHSKAGYSEISGALDRLMKMMGIEYRIERESYPFLIRGRSGRVVAGGRTIGFIGEVHPGVLRKFGVEFPVALFEISQI